MRDRNHSNVTIVQKRDNTLQQFMRARNHSSVTIVQKRDNTLQQLMTALFTKDEFASVHEGNKPKVCSKYLLEEEYISNIKANTT